MEDTLVQVVVREELTRIDFGRQYEDRPLYVTNAVRDLIDEEPELAKVRLGSIATEMTVVRGYDFTPRMRCIWRPMVMVNPSTGAHTEDLRFCMTKYDGEDCYLVMMDKEPFPNGFQLAFHK